MVQSTREGGNLKPASITINGGSKSTLTAPDDNDWLAVIAKSAASDQ